MLTKFDERNRGFTLIELLVVISIIGLLSSVVLASLQTARQKAKNAKTVQEMNQLKIAFELYRSDKGKYPNEGVRSTMDTYPSMYEGDLIAYLESELVNNKYISAVSNLATVHPGWDFAPMAYVTGGDWRLYSEENDYYQTCGGKILKGYILVFYSDQDLNYPKPGYYQGSYYPGERAF
jgi:type II secretion system protein G